MNKTLKEFAKQTEEYAESHHSEEIQSKFAELIVKKCYTIIESHGVDPAFTLRMGHAIRDYFESEKEESKHAI